MVDPRARRAAQERRNRHGHVYPESRAPVALDPAEVMALGLELGPLRDLPWPPLAQRIEALSGALRGGEGVGPGLVQQLRRWAGTWSTLHPDLRAFYASHAGHPAGEAAVWRILEGGRLTGPLRGQLERLWLDDHGAPPTFSLVPILAV